MEQWKDIKGYEGVYQVSNFGNIKSLKRKVNCKNGSFREIPEKIVVPLYTSNGYLNVIASKNQKRETLVIHHLVAKYFIGERPDGLVIDHIDGNRTNNHESNLRYVTCSENLRKRKDMKLNESIVNKIFSMPDDVSQSKIAKEFNISQSMVSMIRNGKRWKNV